ncbi:MAG TPA: type II toxin-antitoxin system ParD family antitoxin [Allosphingosinicella sp.]
MDNQPQLSADDEALIEEAVRSGRYASRSEVLDEGLVRVREREAQIAAVRAAVQRGLDDVKAGRVVNIEEGFAEIYAMLDDMEAARRA